MNALRTIVTTAVIVFGLTSVATAAVHSLQGGSQSPAVAPAVTAQAAPGVVLTQAQFARLLRAATNGRTQQGRTTARAGHRQTVRHATDTVGTGHETGNANGRATHGVSGNGATTSGAFGGWTGTGQSGSGSHGSCPSDGHTATCDQGGCGDDGCR